MQITRCDDRERFYAVAGPAPLTPETVAYQRPDASWLLCDTTGNAVGRFSLWWTHAPAYSMHRLGLIGHLAAADASLLDPLLASASEQLAEQGCTLAVGPMDGSTWQRYRLLTERGTEPAFFLEPDNPDDWPARFEANGFAPLARYCSAVNDDLSRQDERGPEILSNVMNQGISIRCLDSNCFEEELRGIHELSLAAFAGNALYTPIDGNDFVAQYSSIRPAIRPELILIAEREGHVVGYGFALPDLAQAKRGQAIDTVIIKTLAVHPRWGHLGLGSLLGNGCHEAARRLGYRRAIHALMHDDNRSRRLSAHSGRVMRRYALYAKEL